MKYSVTYNGEIIKKLALSAETKSKIDDEIDYRIERDEDRLKKGFRGLSGVFTYLRKDRQKYIDSACRHEMFKVKEFNELDLDLFNFD